MTRRLLIGPALSLGALLAAGVMFTSPAAAQGGLQMVKYGWWLSANHDNTFTAPYSSVGPDAADLHVAYGPNIDGAESTDVTSPVNGPVEVSALLFKLPDAIPFTVSPDIPIATLKLQLDPSYTPVQPPQSSLLACPSLNPWFPDLGGNWNSRVTYNPGSACAPGQPISDSSGKYVSFTITAGMLKDQGASIDLAIVPGFDPIGAGVLQDAATNQQPPNPPQQPWAVNLLKPVPADVTLSTEAFTAGSGFSIPQEGSSMPAFAGGSLPAAGPGGLGSFGLPPAAGGTAPPAAKPGYTVPNTLPVNAGARLGAFGQGRLLAAGLLLLLFLGGLLVMGSDMQRLLTPAGQTAGIGRFARPRSAPPVPI